MPPTPKLSSHETDSLKKTASACDSCRLRRVKCDLTASPGLESCLRCVAKGIRCTTTLATPKKSKERTGKRIEQAKAAYGRTDDAARTPSQALVSAKPACIRAESTMVDVEVTGELVVHLLQLYQRLPGTSTMFPCTSSSLVTSFEGTGRRLDRLRPSTQALVLAIVGVTARVSTHPALLGPGSPVPTLSDSLSVDDEGHELDARASSLAPYAVGCRRESACSILREKALEHAWKHQILRPGHGGGDGGTSHEEAVATCYLLGWLDMPAYCDLDDATGPTVPSSERSLWYAGFVSHLRAQRRQHFAQGEASRSNETTLQWCMQIMREALTGAPYEEKCQYTLQDEVLVAGPPPPAPEEVFANANAPSGVQWWDTQMFWELVRPYTYHITKLTLDGFDWNVRRRANLPFLLNRLQEHVAAIKPLHSLLTLLHARFSVAFSAEAASMRLHSYASRTSGARATERQDEAQLREGKEREDARKVLEELTNALAHVCVPIWVDVEARLDSPVAGDDMKTLETVMRGLRRALLPYVVRTWTHGSEGKAGTSADPTKFWTYVFLSSPSVEDGGEIVTRAQKLHIAESLWKTLRLISYSWPRIMHSRGAHRVKATLQTLRLEQMFDALYEPIPTESISDVSSGSDPESTPAIPSCRHTSDLGDPTPVSAPFDLPDIEAVIRSTGVFGGDDRTASLRTLDDERPHHAVLNDTGTGDDFAYCQTPYSLDDVFSAGLDSLPQRFVDETFFALSSSSASDVCQDDSIHLNWTI